MIFRKIDKDGFFIEDVLEAGEDIIDVPCADGFYLPRFNGTEWVEGGIPPTETVPVDLKAIAIDKIELATTVTTLKKAVLEYVTAEN